MTGRRLLAALATTALVFGVAAPAAGAPGPADAPEYWFDTWHVPQLWQQGARGQGMTIGEIDTGVNASWPELAGNVLPGKDFGVPGGDGRTDREVNQFGHGTAMASIMVAQPGELDITGLAPDAKILPIAVPLTGTTDSGEDDHLADAIRWAADHGAKVISMSLGGQRRPTVDTVPCPEDEQAAIYYALQKGDVLLASSGNTGLAGNLVEEPGVCLGVISVGAVDATGTVADFSSRHPYLTLTAPGVNIPSLSRELGIAFHGDGTSQATAIASAVIALVWSRFPALTARQVVARILASTDHHSTTRDPAYGYGIVNAYRAITQSVPADAPDPVYAFADPFVARTAAFATAKTVLPPGEAATGGDTGGVSIGAAPRLLAPRVLEGGGVALAGLVALLALLAVGIVRRRNRRNRGAGMAAGSGMAAAGAGGLFPGASGGAYPQPGATTTDQTGLVWHEILDSPGEPALPPSSEAALRPSSEPALPASSEPALRPSSEPALRPSSEPALRPPSEPDLRPPSQS